MGKRENLKGQMSRGEKSKKWGEKSEKREKESPKGRESKKEGRESKGITPRLFLSPAMVAPACLAPP